VVVNAETLLVQIPQALQTTLRHDGHADNASPGRARSLKYFEWNAVRRCVTYAVGLAIPDCLCQLLVGFLDELDVAGPGFGEFLQQLES
jgi:hypothetical protein